MKNLAPLVLSLSMLTACHQNSGPPDFPKLVADAFPEGGQRDEAAISKLWAAANKLPRWQFVTTQDLISQKQPSIELIEGQSYLVAFTDVQLARPYAQYRGQALAAPPKPASPSPTELGPSPFDVAAPADAGPARPNPYVGDDGAPLLLSWTPDEACAYLSAYSGPKLSGVRFNEGTHGFWGDVDAVLTIRKRYKERYASNAGP
jgi:hypothetical protein